MQVEIKCPYCGHANKVDGARLSFPEVLFCDVDSGGCDAEYIAKVTQTISTSVHTAKMPELKEQSA